MSSWPNLWAFCTTIITYYTWSHVLTYTSYILHMYITLNDNSYGQWTKSSLLSHSLLPIPMAECLCSLWQDRFTIASRITECYATFVLVHAMHHQTTVGNIYILNFGPPIIDPTYIHNELGVLQILISCVIIYRLLRVIRKVYIMQIGIQKWTQEHPEEGELILGAICNGKHK